MNTKTDWFFLIPNFPTLTYQLAQKGFVEGVDYAIGKNERDDEIVTLSFPFSSIFRVKAKVLDALKNTNTIYSIVDNERVLTDYDTSTGLELGKYRVLPVGQEKPTNANNWLLVSGLYFVIESILPPVA